MFFRHFCWIFVILLSAGTSMGAAEIVINEIHYNPIAGSDYEFIELYNPTSATVELSGYAFTQGINYTFLSGATMKASEYLLVAQNPSSYSRSGLNVQIVGPYIGKLSNEGEAITLRAPDGHIVDTLTYSSMLPWPRGADGYGPSLERISPDLPANNFHSWRASAGDGGTPGKLNSVNSSGAQPAIVSFTVNPPHPTSADETQITVVLDSPDWIQNVSLRYEPWTTSGRQTRNSLSMASSQKNSESIQYQCTIPAFPSQTLIRFDFEITRTDGKILRLPYVSEPRPFESYFVYDNEIPAKLPILWIFPDLKTYLSETGANIRGIAVKNLDSPGVQVFDGVLIEKSLVDNSGLKIKFLKGEEFRGDRTINICPESPTHPNSGGANTPHVEHIGFNLFRDLGVLSPRIDWYRIIELGNHTQRTATQQPNEKFLELNGRDPNSNIYKIAYNEPNRYPYLSGRINYSKQTNLDEGVDDLYEFFGAINSSDKATSAWALRQYLVVEEAINNSVAGVLISNWDGFFNNMFLVHNLFPVDRWEIVPWDLDKTFGYTDGSPPTSTMFVEMPLTFPLDGRARLASREPGPISKPLHSDPELNDLYLKKMREALDGIFTPEKMNPRIDAVAALLLEDLQLLETYTGKTREDRRQQIQKASDTLRTFVRLRHDFLRPQLPVAVIDWELY